jgi:hypothetical protein
MAKETETVALPEVKKVPSRFRNALGKYPVIIADFV